MKVVIVEDENLAVEKLQRLLTNVDPSVEVVKTLESVEESVNWFSNNSDYNLIFMDIQLDDGISFEIFESVKIESPIIFTTAYDEYAVRAFKVNSVDYLLKPVDEEALKLALKKFREIYVKPEDIESKIVQVFQHLSKSFKERFFVKVGVHFQSIPVKEISCFFVEERCTFLKTRTGKNYDLDYSLDQIQKMIDPNQFFRINRNFLVNLKYINHITSYSTSRLKLSIENFNDNDLIVSRDKVSEFKSWLDR